MATRTRRSSSRSRSRSQSTSGQVLDSLRLPPHVARSLFGLLLIVVGVLTLIALVLPADGILNRYVVDFLRPLFGQGAWLLAILLIVAGIAVERPGTLGYGSSLTLIGGLVVFAAGLGLIHLIWGHGSADAALRDGGGALGIALSRGLSDLISPIGAFVVLLGLLVAGILLLFNITLRTLLTPVAGGGRMIAKAMATPARALAEGASARRAEAAANARSTEAVATKARTRSEKPERTPRETKLVPESLAPEQQLAPLSQTIWSAQLNAEKVAKAEKSEPTKVADEGDTEATTPARVWSMPGYELLDVEGVPGAGGQRLDHARNIRIIEDKLASFQIPAAVVATNSGPVVTQYEVKPEANVKLSRIEGLADDLAMALAARSIRIEAPIPGRDVVGIEIPNHNSEIVGFKRLLEDAGMTDATSKLTFALGRDVSGKAYAVDLARMPHLLIAGATGSGKSVCVNALIGSLLMRATPEEVRLILVDLKRVELAAYRDIPHLETPVIVESHEARAVLTNLVHEMEHRYELLAEAMERNLASFNVSPRRIGKPMPYMVVVIDELADLILREGRKVEEPIVKIAQKARAVGIHLVLATQRPSVNVVTGLIKANVPSRIAFAMASNVDSRTVLDAPGAEDLIGRGDMLYQPADLPRPVRLQGVFVSDPEIHAITDFWRNQAEPTYNRDMLAGADIEDGGEGGQFAWLAKGADDELVSRAAELVTQTGRASTSMLQTKLKVGFNRATRIIDELEKHGIIGPLDTRNPGAPRTVYGPDNWIRDTAQADAEL
jgi:S-DNA-T family DNA segregation ATPase FtsK/SpoIIIE